MDVASSVGRVAISASRVRDLVIRTLASERVRDALISVAFVGVSAMSKLNRGFLSQGGPTDVISFGFGRHSRSQPVIGDIYICPWVAGRNARGLGIPLRDELARLVVHGALHVLGHDHPEGGTRTSSAMWRKQERILESLD